MVFKLELFVFGNLTEQVNVIEKHKEPENNQNDGEHRQKTEISGRDADLAHAIAFLGDHHEGEKSIRHELHCRSAQDFREAGPCHGRAIQAFMTA